MVHKFAVSCRRLLQELPSSSSSSSSSCWRRRRSSGDATSAIDQYQRCCCYSTSPPGRGFASTATTTASTTDIITPEQANVVIIGGGIIGASVAYHLGKLGVQDVLLLERNKLTSGTTWHAAGLINTFGSLSATSTFMRMYTKDLYANILPQETGMSCGYMPIGFIELACDTDRLEYYRRVAAFNRYCGVDVTEISPEEVRDRCPIIDTTDVISGFYVKDDGRANPTDVTMALIRGAKQNGVQVLENVSVSGVTTTSRWEEDHRTTAIPHVTGVTLSSGEHIQANAVANCAGMWARQLGELSGVTIPNQAAEHYYLITEPFDEVDPSWPVVEDSSRCVYIRPEGGGLMLGLFERMGASWNVHKIPETFSFGEINADWDRIGPYLLEAMKRVPITEQVGTKALFCGPESFTPDGNPIVGESSEIRNYYVAAGMNSIGILTGGGIGKILAQWIQDGRAPNDVDVTVRFVIVYLQWLDHSRETARITIVLRIFLQRLSMQLVSNGIKTIQGFETSV